MKSGLESQIEAKDSELVGSRVARLKPDLFTNQSGAAMEDGEEETDEEEDGEALADEPTDDEGNPTGQHDHHQDDNYQLGGHVTRSGGS